MYQFRTYQGRNGFWRLYLVAKKSDELWKCTHIATWKNNNWRCASLKKHKIIKTSTLRAGYAMIDGPLKIINNKPQGDFITYICTPENVADWILDRRWPEMPINERLKLGGAMRTYEIPARGKQSQEPAEKEPFGAPVFIYVVTTNDRPHCTFTREERARDYVSVGNAYEDDRERNPEKYYSDGRTTRIHYGYHKVPLNKDIKLWGVQ